MGNEHNQPESFYTEQRANKDVQRARQRDMILGQLTDDQHGLLQRLFPKDTIIHHEGDELLAFISPLDFEKQEGEGYRLLFGMACTAQTPIELANIFGAIRALSEITEPRATEYRIWRSYYTFLEKTDQKPGTFFQMSRVAKYIEDEVIQWANTQVRFDKTQVGVMANLFFNRGNESYKKRRPYLAETFLSTILNSSYNPRWRGVVLQHAQEFEFTMDAIADLPESIFADDASYWTSVEGSWAGIDISQQPEPETLLLASELTTDERAELERLRRERILFRQKEQGWFNKKASLGSQIATLQVDNEQLYKRTNYLDRENQRLQRRAEKAEQELWTLRRVAGGAGQREAAKLRSADATDPFISGFGYTIDQIERMPSSQKNSVISFLRKEAGRAFHPDNGINPDNERMKAMNELLDRLSKK